MKKKTKVIIFTTISIIILIILTPTVIFKIPIQHVEMEVETNDGPSQELVEGENMQIYVYYNPEPPYWRIIGKDGVMFNGAEESIFIVGEFPNKMNYDLVYVNTFVLNGKYLGKKKRKNTIAGCFYVENWGVLGQLKRREGVFGNLSKSSITVADKIFAEPSPKYDLDELEDVEDTK